MDPGLAAFLRIMSLEGLSGEANIDKAAHHYEL